MKLFPSTKQVVKVAINDHVPKTAIIPPSTEGNVSVEAALEVVAAAASSDRVGLALVPVLLVLEEGGEDVLVGTADEVLASGSPSLSMRKV